MRTDIGKNQGVTTVIESDADGDLETGGREGEKLPIQGVTRKQSFGREGGAGGRGQWNTSESKLTDLSSDDELAWGIRKTTVQTQIAH